jgi:hypothetical protein
MAVPSGRHDATDHRSSHGKSPGPVRLWGGLMIPFVTYYTRVQHYVESVYHLRVVITDIPDPLTGDLDGAEIVLDYALTPAQRLFVLVHLFGHTVQWNTDPRAVELGRQQHPPVNEEVLPALLAYEQRAACYALTLLHQVGITDLDQWLADYTACDRAYLAHYYRTGEKRPFLAFWQDHTPLVTPLPIPPFTPAKKSFRLTDGRVI